MTHSVVEVGKKSSILRIGGELDAVSTPELRPTIEALSHDRGCNITVDLSNCKHIDSSGLGALVSLYKQTCANRGTVSFVGVGDQPLVLFKLLKLDRVFQLDRASSPDRAA